MPSLYEPINGPEWLIVDLRWFSYFLLQEVSEFVSFKSWDFYQGRTGLKILGYMRSRQLKSLLLGVLFVVSFSLRADPCVLIHHVPNVDRIR